MLTVKDLLQIKSIEGIQIVAGEKGINNKVSIVNIMENPDTFDWLTSNELLLSTGYIFKDSVDLQNRIIKELAEINCSGLCIKMKRYFDKIPQNMIDLANQYDFPLLELPFGYTLSQVISIINEKATGAYDLLNRKSLDMHKKLFRISLEGGGIDKISSELAKTINNPILFLDRDWNLLHYVDLEENKISLASYLNLEKNRSVFSKEFTDSIPENIKGFKKAIKRNYDANGFEIKCRILPVAVSDYIYGYLVVWQTVSDLTEFDYIVLEDASRIMALERIKAREIEEVKLKIRQDFFDDLLTGKITSNDNIQTLCDLHGLKSDYMHYCIVIDIEPDETRVDEDIIARKYKLENNAKKCVNLIYDLSRKSANGEVISFYRNNRIIILVGKKEFNPTSTKDEAKIFSNELYKSLTKEIPATTFLFGIGSQYKTISTLHKSFFEAHEAIRLMKQFNNNTVVSHFEDYSVYHFLGSNIKNPELEDFFIKSLGKIYDHDNLHGTGYLTTLESYFQNNHNLSETAKALFIHRNTLIYRIEKIREILNTDLKNSEELLQIQLALKVYRLLPTLHPDK
ncbi:PucR family transcriptional regulator [Bacillus sp. 1NLA3E]|uniref:PucR family transcriptional regulator n=1 Tax=Bacillus sp. 1NLA3E TaxID=666686 RepID=UPI000247EB5E|nr:PucR family transcriptional regulator [Bacillus sp. 1NLA3E]